MTKRSTYKEPSYVLNVCVLILLYISVSMAEYTLHGKYIIKFEFYVASLFLLPSFSYTSVIKFIDTDISWVCLHGDISPCLHHGCVAGVSLAPNCLCDVADSVVHVAWEVSSLPCSRSKLIRSHMYARTHIYTSHACLPSISSRIHTHTHSF